jgi:hypothetical protein
MCMSGWCMMWYTSCAFAVGVWMIVVTEFRVWFPDGTLCFLTVFNGCLQKGPMFLFFPPQENTSGASVYLICNKCTCLKHFCVWVVNICVLGSQCGWVKTYSVQSLMCSEVWVLFVFFCWGGGRRMKKQFLLTYSVSCFYSEFYVLLILLKI